MPVVYRAASAPTEEAFLSEGDRRVLGYDSHTASQHQSEAALPTPFPLYPVQGGRSDAEHKPCGQVPLYFYYLKTLVPRAWERAAGTAAAVITPPSSRQLFVSV